jgi:hypothetical protein
MLTNMPVFLGNPEFDKDDNEITSYDDIFDAFRMSLQQ